MTDKLNKIGLDKKISSDLSDKLNELLANYQIFYMNARGFHWNIKGEKFFELHAKFEELYNDSLVKIDEIAERILTLRHHPVSRYSDYLEISKIEESDTLLEDVEMVETLLSDHGILISKMSHVVKVCENAEDEGTIDLIGAYIRELEKTSWMLNAWSKNTKKEKATA